MHLESIIYKASSPFQSGWSIGVDQNDANCGAGKYRIEAAILTPSNWNSASYPCQDSSSISVWNHYVLVYNDSILKLYVNNSLQDSTIFQESFVNNSNNIEIGGSVNPVSGAYNRIIDDIRIYNRVLSNSEISAIFNEGLCYQTITVTDTLIINANLTSYNPVAYQNTIKIFPNPSNDHISIDFGSNYSTMNGYTLKITNSLSQIVYTTPVNQQLTTVDLSTWTGNGIYFVHLIDSQSNTIDIKKIVLQ
jgi:hypothetical protein